MFNIAFFRDGPFLPALEGGSESLLGLIEGMLKYANVFLFRCYRGWDDYNLYQKKNFNTIFIKPEDYYSNGILLNKLLKKFKIDVCHFDSAEAVCIQVPLMDSSLLKVWEVMNVNHTLLERMGKDSQIVENAKKYELEASLMSDLILCRSLKDTGDLTSIGVNPSKIKQYRGCINTNNFEFNSNRLGQKIILFLGNMFYGPNENAVKLIQDKIVPKIMEQMPSSHFVFVGNYPLYLESRTLNYRNHVQFLGGVDDLNPFLSKASVALCPLFEGSGTRLKLLTYLAAGIPTISSKLGIEGLSEEIEKYMFIENKIENYSNLILKVLSKPYSENKLKKARKWTEENYSWNIESKNIVKLYKEAFLTKIK